MCWASGFSTQQLVGSRIGQGRAREDRRQALTKDNPRTALLRSLWNTEVDFQEVFMGCTIYAASPKALPADEATGQDRYHQQPHYSPPHGNCSHRLGASRARSVINSQQWSVTMRISDVYELLVTLMDCEWVKESSLTRTMCIESLHLDLGLCDLRCSLYENLQGDINNRLK